eukprot:TRINITY_DN991_c0_g1_i9.p3 TRINITY_DN991_c0_g1~~TRINITY_DN991_c0_g1_i9.p3  ORF type:complete len:141 (-),score=19.79 TRINITY_DN991_c0_g1_i9:121-543(-)
MKDYLDAQIKSGPSSILTKCPSCEEILNMSFIIQMLMKVPTQMNLKTLYEKFLIGNYIQNSVNYKWCPGPGCTKIFHFPKLKNKSEIQPKNLKCHCGYSFCAKCENEAHRPLSCSLLSSWNNLYYGKDENLNKTLSLIHI